MYYPKWASEIEHFWANFHISKGCFLTQSFLFAGIYRSEQTGEENITANLEIFKKLDNYAMVLTMILFST